MIVGMSAEDWANLPKSGFADEDPWGDFGYCPSCGKRTFLDLHFHQGSVVDGSLLRAV